MLFALVHVFDVRFRQLLLISGDTFVQILHAKVSPRGGVCRGGIDLGREIIHA